MLQAKNETFVQAAESDLARDLAYAYYYKVWSNLIVTAVIPMGKLNPALCTGDNFTNDSNKELIFSYSRVDFLQRKHFLSDEKIPKGNAKFKT